MKKQFILFVLIVLATHSYAQNYQLINSNKIRHFIANDLNFYSIRIDSTKSIGTDNYYYNYKVLKTFTTLQYPCALEHTDSSWIGHQIISQNNGNYTFFNKELKSITIQSTAQLGTSWQLYQFNNGDYIEATINSIDTQTILGGIDSVKVIELQAKNSTNTAVTHPLNGKTIVFSKENGLVQILNISDFPNNSSPYILAGNESPNTGIVRLTDFDIFDYNIGDEFHFSEDSYGPSAIYPYFLRKEIQKILTKTISTNQDTIIYDIKRCIRTRSNFNNGIDTTYIYDTIQQIITNTGQFNYVTNEILKDSSAYAIFGQVTYSNNKRSVTKANNYRYDPINNCWEHFSGTVSPKKRWVEGLGGPLLIGFSHNRSLIYYKKGAEVWGDPINCTTFTGVQSVHANDHSIKIFPNPFSESTTIQIEAFIASDNWTLNLVDITGKNVRSMPISQQTITLNKESLTAGVYFYQITNVAKHKQYTGKIILH